MLGMNQTFNYRSTFYYPLLRFIGIAACCFFVLPLSAQNGEDILKKAATIYEQSNGLSAPFTMHMREGEYSESFEGEIQIKGDKFTLRTPDMLVWYDGKTQWCYMVRNEEVNMTEPAGDELTTINPVLLLQSYKKGYTASFKGESTAASGKTAYDVELIPRKKEDINRIVLQIEKISSLPVRISIELKNGGNTTIQIGKMSTGLNQPDSFFVFNSKDYQDAEVIDLR